MSVRDVRVVIAGSGFGGIAMAARLHARAMDDFVVLERGSDVGGTWRDNTYPGAACDVPSHLYSFSFATNPAWTHAFSPQPEIQAYLKRVARDHGVLERCLFGAEMHSATWDEVSARWHVRTSRGDFRAQFLVGATGGLSDPASPDLPGLDAFKGATFHSARWNHDYDLRGKSVAVIGTGASAIQFVPQIAPLVDQLYVHQRTAPWIVPRNDHARGRRERWIYRHIPGSQRAARTAIYWGREAYVLFYAKRPALARLPQKMADKHLTSQVPDPLLRKRLRPDFGFGCKRVLISNDYYPALRRPNVELVTEPITEVRTHSVVTADGAERPVDTIIFATGFHVTDLPVAKRIHNGAGVSLAEHWSDGMQALRGTTVEKFPNLFVIVGPNTGLGHTSMVFMIESQVNYIDDAIRQMDARGLAAMAPTEAAVRTYNDEVQAKLAPSVWNTGGCRSWYLDARGRNTTLWPDFTFRFHRATRKVDLAEYDTVKVTAGSRVDR
jgi:cation diffusion facilitator CzcD-associated flavoprotein CzcO